MHYHVTNNTPGYVTESDPDYVETLEDALLILADDLRRCADDLYERCEAFRMPDDRRPLDEDERTEQEAMEKEGDRVHGIANNIDDTVTHGLGSVTLEGEPWLLSLIATGGLSVGVEDPSKMHDLGTNYHLTPCAESECEELAELYA